MQCFFFFKQKTAYEIMPSLVGSEMCIRDIYKVAKQQVMKSGQYAFRDRRQRKRDFRKLWITRINAAARQHDISYSRLMNGLKKAEIDINRKMLSEIAISDDKAFAELVSKAKEALK
ncbi:50S ribosomal protein L20 [Clostridioides difficile]|nr:50S ribosomal protein L20 [Clostridioides difficile]